MSRVLLRSRSLTEAYRQITPSLPNGLRYVFGMIRDMPLAHFAIAMLSIYQKLQTTINIIISQGGR